MSLVTISSPLQSTSIWIGRVPSHLRFFSQKLLFISIGKKKFPLGRKKLSAKEVGLVGEVLDAPRMLKVKLQQMIF